MQILTARCINALVILGVRLGGLCLGGEDYRLRCHIGRTAIAADIRISFSLALHHI